MASFYRTAVLTLALIVVEALSLPVRAAQLPPPIVLDRELVRLERLVSEGSYYQALTVLDEIRALQQEHPDLVLPEDLSYRYAEIAMELGMVREAIDAVQ